MLQEPMMNKLTAMRLLGMVDALKAQEQDPASRELSFDELLAKNADLLDHEHGALRAHYDSAMLSSDLARAIFVLPRLRREEGTRP